MCNILLCFIIYTYLCKIGNIHVREGFTKKVAVLLDFVQMRGGGEGPAQIFRPLFTNCIYLGQFGDGEGGGHPCPNFLSPFHKCIFGQ